MEDQIKISPPGERVRIRKRVPRKRTPFERIAKLLEMPHLKRHERNQRVALGGVLLLALVYFGAVRPIMNRFFPPAARKGVQITAPAPRPGLTGKGR